MRWLLCGVLLVLVLGTGCDLNADGLVRGCTIVQRPDQQRHTVCPNVDLRRARLGGRDPRLADLRGANLALADLGVPT